MKSVPVDQLKKFLRYDAETGILYWREREREFFKSDNSHKRWNNMYAGKPAMDHINKRGYKGGSVLGVHLRAHRVAWAMHYGHFPEGLIDHINGNCSDNRIENLRVVDARGNARNQKVSARSKTGVCGVYKRADSNRFEVKIATDHGYKYLGLYAKISDAEAVRKAAEVENGYHVNHGRKEVV